MLNCVPEEAAYTVEFDFAGGDATSYQIEGGTIDLLPGLIYHFVSDPIPSGTPFSFEISDDSNCNPLLVEGAGIDCEACQSNAGTMESQVYNLCQTETAVLNHLDTDLFLEESDSLWFVLHDGTDDPLGNIIATNDSAAFDFLFGTMITDETYYVAAVVGNVDSSGLFDLTDPCLSISNSVPVSFFTAPGAPSELQVSDTLLCPGSSLELLTNTMPEGVRYRWITPTGDTSTAEPLLVLDPFREENTGDYYVAAEVNGCASLPFGPITVNLDQEVGEINAGQDTVLCGENSIELSAANPNFADGEWNVNTDAVIFFPDQPSTFVGDLAPGINTFTWSAFTTNCLVTDTVLVEYVPRPEAVDDFWDLKADKNTAIYDMISNDILDGIDSSTTVIELLSQPEYGGFEFEDNGTYFLYRDDDFTEPTTFTFDYQICNTAAGCNVCDTATVTIEVAYSDNIAIYPDFGLRPEGNNETWGFTVARPLKEGRIHIADRWGRIVLDRTLVGGELLQSTRVEAWRGVAQNEGGNLLPAGAYYFWFDGKTAEDLTVKQNGILYLVR